MHNPLRIQEISICIGHVAFGSITGLKGSGKNYLNELNRKSIQSPKPSKSK